MRKRKTKDLENKLFNAGEKHEGNCQDRGKKNKFKHYCHLVGLSAITPD